jgi:ankyrin repeat protein
MSPLHHAAERGHLDSVKLLVSNGAKINTRDEEARSLFTLLWILN